VQDGVQIIGGCCGIGPEYIRLLRQGLPTRIPAARKR
jgi:methionine synthase I (cobalamin-dependent)